MLAHLTRCKSSLDKPVDHVCQGRAPVAESAVKLGDRRIGFAVQEGQNDRLGLRDAKIRQPSNEQVNRVDRPMQL